MFDGMSKKKGFFCILEGFTVWNQCCFLTKLLQHHVKISRMTKDGNDGPFFLKKKINKRLVLEKQFGANKHDQSYQELQSTVVKTPVYVIIWQRPIGTLLSNNNNNNSNNIEL